MIKVTWDTVDTATAATAVTLALEQAGLPDRFRELSCILVGGAIGFARATGLPHPLWGLMIVSGGLEGAMGAGVFQGGVKVGLGAKVSSRKAASLVQKRVKGSSPADPEPDPPEPPAEDVALPAPVPIAPAA